MTTPNDTQPRQSNPSYEISEGRSPADKAVTDFVHTKLVHSKDLSRWHRHLRHEPEAGREALRALDDAHR